MDEIKKGLLTLLADWDHLGPDDVSALLHDLSRDAAHVQELIDQEKGEKEFYDYCDQHRLTGNQLI